MPSILQIQLIWPDLLTDYISTFFKKVLCFRCDGLNIQGIKAGVADHSDADLAAFRRHPFQGLARHLQQGGAEEPINPVVPAGTLQLCGQEILQWAAT
jgi:hypothetical protein